MQTPTNTVFKDNLFGEVSLSKIRFKLLICLAKSYIAYWQIQVCCGEIITSYELVASELMRFYYKHKAVLLPMPNFH